MTAKRKNNPIITGVIFVIISAVTIFMGTWLTINLKEHKQRCTESVTAKIVENITVRSRKKTKHGHRTVTTYRPVFSFEYDGNNYRVESSSSHKPALFDVGEHTKIKINPDAPDEIYVPADKFSDYAGIIFVAVGVIFLAVGILVIVKSH
ncbi:MAG: DUF3592 domain-containing protein [Ruminococcus sp.]|nr:DUF3592 domain-containing protein [Ruminococcus sp.]